MTAVAPPIAFQQLSRTSWPADPNAQGGLDSMSAGEVTRMLMPRKGAQRSNSSTSLSSTSSSSSSTSTATITSQPNGQLMQNDAGGWASKRKAPNRGLWPPSKAEPTTGVSRGPDGNQQSAILPSQRMLQSQQNGTKPGPPQPHADGIPVLYLFPINSTFDRKQITVPWFPDVLRIGRQTNTKTVPTPTNGYFDSKVLSRQHAEIWADRLGKIFIKDVRSSNGTFVNGQRLSQENRDSDPHELRESDILELGIDIVSEDQKTVVHHKVAARVEHAGLISSNSEILNLNFGDIDPTAVGSMTGPNISHAMSQLRRNGGQGVLGSTARPQGLQGNEISRMGQRNLNFLLTPITMEQIVKRLNSELKTANQQADEIGFARNYFQQVESDPSAFRIQKELDQPINNSSQPAQTNGISSKGDTKSRFLDPPAPPPQQPLPEKPDFSKSASEAAIHPSLKRNETAKPLVSSFGTSPKDSSSHIVSLVEALTTAKREIETQGSRLRDLESLLQQEREARESAENRASKLEAQVQRDGSSAKAADDQSYQNSSRLSRLFSNSSSKSKEPETSDMADRDQLPVVRDFDDEDSSSNEDDKLAAESAARLQQRLDLMVVEMNEMKMVMEKYKLRVEDAETKAKSSQQSLAEMVEKVRKEESAREAKALSKRSAKDSTESPHDDAAESTHTKGVYASGTADSTEGLTDRSRASNGNVGKPAEVATLDRNMATMLAHFRQDQLTQSAPYASILTVFFVGVGLMTYLNGWQKVEK